MRGDFGPFEPLFARSPGYLSLLRLWEPDAAGPLVGSIRHIVSTATPADVDRLFAGPNWRPHLVGAVAPLLVEHRAACVPQAWQAVDAGSWVTPQLVVCLSFADREFPREARSRVESGCPVRPATGMTPLEHHVVAGPGGPIRRSAKGMASLLAVCESAEDLRTWAESMRTVDSVRAILGADIDDSGAIVRDWQDKLVGIFAGLGHPLPPRRWNGC